MSFRTVVTLAVVATALGFVPSSRRASSSSLTMSMTDLPGAVAPLGFFDPAGFSTKTDDPKEINRLREAELKHGRVCMLAAVGILVGEAVEFSSLFGNKVTGPALYQFQEADQLTGFGFAAAIVGLISIIEGYGLQRNWESGKVRGDITPGDLNWDPLGLKPSDPEALAAMQTKEINNGRLAMIGVAGMIVQELVNGKGILENLGLEGTLPKAFDTGIL